jgi:disulfide bond formation protein DsbB
MNPLDWSFRSAFAFAAGIAAALLGYGYWLQFFGGLEPCPLCIFQRVAFIGIFTVCLVAAIHGPRGKVRFVYGALAFVAAAAGAGVAIRHLWLQSLPADQVPACGPGLEYLMEAFPLAEVVRLAFTGSGECAEIDWSFLGLSMPGWSLIWFILFAIGAGWFGFRRRA